MLRKICKNCGSDKHTSFQCWLNRKPLKAKKPMKKIGKKTELYIVWRDTMAIPYLDKRFGRICSKRGCEETEGLEVDHIKNRSTHPELKMRVTNVQYLCNPHHQEKTYRLEEA